MIAPRMFAVRVSFHPIPARRGYTPCAILWMWALALAPILSSCGGAVTSVSDPAPTVSVSPLSSSIAVNGVISFTVTVQNASNPAVIWEVNGTPGGDATVGTITAAGSYQAPAMVPTPAMVTVTAVLEIDASQSGSASVTVTPPPNPSVSVFSPVSSVAVNGSAMFNATVQNYLGAVVWEVNGVEGGNSTFGTISWSGSNAATYAATYEAPKNVPTPPTVTITAVLQLDLATSGSSGLLITAAVPPPASVTVSPPTASVPIGGMAQFGATVQNAANPTVSWEVNGMPGGSLLVGTITSSGLYQAPTGVPSPATVAVTAVLQADSTISGFAGVTVTPLSAFVGNFSWRNDNMLSGVNSAETLLTPTSVSSANFGKLSSCTVDGEVYAQPLYVSNVTILGAGTYNVIYVATENDSVFAFDADNLCTVLWQDNFLNPVAGVTTVPSTDISTTAITPQVGITGTPVIDPTTGTLYVIAATKEGTPASYVQRLHALDIVTGNEKFGGPMPITASVSGTGDGTKSGQVAFDTLTENQSAALTLVQSGGAAYVVVTFGSYGNVDPFHGWVMVYNAATLAQTAAFNTTPDGSRGGIGDSGAPPSSDTSGNVFVATGNGIFDANNPTAPNTDYAETLLRLTTAGGNLAVADSFTPYTQSVLSSDVPPLDFGAGGMLLLPTQAGSAAHPNLGIAMGQQGTLYLVDRASLGGYRKGPGGEDAVIQTLNLAANTSATPAYWASSNPLCSLCVYVAGAGDYLRAFQISNANAALSGMAQSSPTGLPGASPVVSSNGGTGGVVWVLDTGGFGTSQPAVLRAFDAVSLNLLYDSSQQSGDTAGVAAEYAVPTVANGKVFVGTQTELDVYGLHWSCFAAASLFTYLRSSGRRHLQEAPSQ